MADILRTANLMKRYGKRAIMRDVTIEVKRGEVVGLLGSERRGKDDDLLHDHGDDPPRRRKRIPERDGDHAHAHVQTCAAGHRVPAAGNVGFPAPLRGRQPARGAGAAADDRRCTQTACHPIDGGIEHFANTCQQRIHAFRRRATAGGDRPRSCNEPEVYFIGQPFAGIDPLAVEEIMLIIARLKAKDIGILITDHNVHKRFRSHRSYILIDGNIFRAGSAHEIANDEDVRKYYLGSKFSLERYGGD